MDIQPIPVSKKRLVLAMYLDFILFMVLFGFLNHFLFPNRDLPFWMALAVFGIIELVCIKVFGSPGWVLLSIDGSRSVDPDIYHRENWLTILLGVLFILEGTKKLVRWMELSVHGPSFGMILDSNIQIPANIMSGLLFIGVGYFFLKLKAAGIWLGLTIVIGTIISCVLSWSLWDETAVGIVTERRQLQGLPVREGEIEFMQAMMPELIIGAAVVFGLGILFASKRIFRVSG